MVAKGEAGWGRAGRVEGLFFDPLVHPPRGGKQWGFCKILELLTDKTMLLSTITAASRRDRRKGMFGGAGA